MEATINCHALDHQGPMSMHLFRKTNEILKSEFQILSILKKNVNIKEGNQPDSHSYQWHSPVHPLGVIPLKLGLHHEPHSNVMRFAQYDPLHLHPLHAAN